MKIPMKRDMGLIRDILLEIEDGTKFYDIRSNEVSTALGIDEESSLHREVAERWNYSLSLLNEAKLVKFSRTGGGTWIVERISWEGHDFLDSIRDPEIWAQTQEGAKKIGGFTVDILAALAKGLIKQKIEKHTGVAIDL